MGWVWRGVSPTQIGRWHQLWDGCGDTPPEKKEIFLLKWHILSKLVLRLPWCNSLQFWCVHTVTNRFYYRNWLTCTAIWNGLHWQIICKPKIPANQQTTTLEWIDSLSSTLCALFTPTPQRPSKLSGSASISGTPSGKSGVGMSTPWRRPCNCGCRFTQVDCNGHKMIAVIVAEDWAGDVVNLAVTLAIVWIICMLYLIYTVSYKNVPLCFKLIPVFPGQLSLSSLHGQ